MSASWQDFFKKEQEKEYYQKLHDAVKQAYNSTTVYPPIADIFRAYRLCSYADTRVVIIGQDPYHGYKQANGLCFSVNSGVAAPPSLINIFKELADDLQIQRTETDLSGWAKQGVLLLNRVLTVQAGQAYSHDDFGWQQFTLGTVLYLNNKTEPLVYVLWGRKAQELKQAIDLTKHHIIESEHPSPLSAARGFFGSRPFSKINEFLVMQGQTPIDFSL